MQNNIDSVAANAKLEERYQVRKAFENGEPLQYRRINPISFEEWRDATWSRWEWARYEYRIKPKQAPMESLVPIYPYFISGTVYWMTKSESDMNTDIPIKKFRTINGVRHAVIDGELL